MPQIINEPGIGNTLGSALGTGLQMLAQNKLQQMMRERQLGQVSKGLEALGYNPQEAQQLSYLDPAIQKEVVKQKLVAPSNQAYAQALGLIGQPSQSPMETMGGLTAHQAEKLATLQQQERQFQQKQEAAEKKLTAQEKLASQKESKEIRSTITQAAKAAKENDQRLSRMEELNEKGDLSSGLFYSGLKTFGLDLPALKSADAQEFDKLTYDFLRNAKSIFGARITNYDVNAMLKMIPSLEQTQEGRKRVINNLKSSNKAIILRDKAMKEIIKENKGFVPFDLESQIEEKIGPELDKLAAQFKRGIKTEEQQIRQEETPQETKYAIGETVETPPTNLPVGTVLTQDGKDIQWDGKNWLDEQGNVVF